MKLKSLFLIFLMVGLCQLSLGAVIEVPESIGAGIMMIGGGAPAAAGQTFMISEDLEGASTCYTGDVTFINCNLPAAKWTTSGSPLFKHNGGGLLEGSYSLDCTDGSVTGSISPAQSNFFWFFEFMGTPNDQDIFQIKDASDSFVFTLSELYAGTFGVWDAVAGSHSTGFTCASSTKYYIWGEYKNGASGYIKIYVSITTTKPAAYTLATTNANTAAKMILLGGFFDRIRVSTTDITGYPTYP
jgi:hypothetical protein